MIAGKRISQATTSNIESPSPGGSFENRKSTGKQMNSKNGDNDDVGSPESPEK